MTIRQGHVALVRVRRVRYGRYTPSEITASCDQEISELQGIPIRKNRTRALRSGARTANGTGTSSTRTGSKR